MSRLFVLLLLITFPAAAQVSPAWTQRYSGPIGDADSAQDLALDPQGNIYVTGVSGMTARDIATVKYSPSGQQLWVRTYDGPAHLNDEGTRIIVRGGFVYVGGTTTVASSAEDYLVIKYDTDGNQIWTARRAGAGQDQLRGLAVDVAGNVYVTGETTAGNFTDITTIKYNPQGQLVWSRSFDGPGHFFDEPRDLRVNAAGEVYVCGHTYLAEDWNALLLKYDAAGTLAWSRILSTPGATAEIYEAIELDSNGEVIVAGSSGTFFLADLVALKYSPQGDLRWTRRVHGPNANTGADSAFGLAIDSARNIYIAGQTFGPAYNLATTIAYDPDGQLRWQDRHDPGAAAAADKVVLDTTGAVYTAVRFDAPAADPLNARVIKYQNGPVWTYTFAGPLGYLDMFHAIAIAPDDSLIAVGVADFGPIGEVGDFLTIKVAPPCYPNCDSSTSPPLLTANDFQCFLNKFAAADSYANCDHSTNPPTLNANDFQCFLNAFASGCQ